ncbi:LacI family DNA-binding transcriptional regulator [Nibricoccus sp. IMCC34717]|uniref:LacI family DNA-binding transcriptional regulator n=1 Tax=Nibricoccus sp. IMCC34717 TaxID=3034021 RepID=UPI003850210C
MNERRVTLSVIAKAAGVHVTTVSLALRNHPRLPVATRERLQALAKKLGYRPDPLLRALVAYRGRTASRRSPSTLAYVTNWDTAYGWKKVTAHPQFYEGARKKAEELGYKLVHFWMREPGLTHSRLSGILEARGIHGVVLASHQREADNPVTFNWDNFSAIKVDYLPHKPELHIVTNDQCGIIRLAVQQVLAAGYKRIGFIMHRGWNHATDRLWAAGFLCEQQVLPENDRVPMLLFPEAEPISEWMNESKASLSISPGVLKEWIQRHQPEVIISKGSFVLPALEALNVKVPRDVAFVDVFLESFDGKTAGVRQNHETVGSLAVEFIAGQLHHNICGIPAIPTTTFVEGTWFAGASCPSLVTA